MCQRSGCRQHQGPTEDDTTSSSSSPSKTYLAPRGYRPVRWQSSDEPACHGRVRDNPRALDKDRRPRDRAHCTHPHPTADELPGGRRCSEPSRSACCCPVYEPPGRVPRRAADGANQPQTCCTASCLTPFQPVRSAAHRSSRSDSRRAPACQMCKNAPRHA
jgi:hypothetical protein